MAVPLQQKEQDINFKHSFETSTSKPHLHGFRKKKNNNQQPNPTKQNKTPQTQEVSKFYTSFFFSFFSTRYISLQVAGTPPNMQHLQSPSLTGRGDFGLGVSLCVSQCCCFRTCSSCIWQFCCRSRCTRARCTRSRRCETIGIWKLPWTHKRSCTDVLTCSRQNTPRYTCALKQEEGGGKLGLKGLKILVKVS